MTPPKRGHFDSFYLKPGEIFTGNRPAKVTTVLGSCVSVTLFHKTLGIGLMSHSVLPKCRTRKICSDYCDEAFRYTECSLKYMINLLRCAGAEREEIEVKLFGGADTLGSKHENTVGSQNVKTALKVIGDASLRIIAADVGDAFGRKLIFFAHTGEVFVKRFSAKSGGCRNA